MKADDGQFEYRGIVYFVVQITTNFVSRYKIWCIFRSADISWTSEMTTWSPKKFNNFVTIKNNTMLHIIFMWLWMSNKCKISCKNSERLLRKWQKTLGDTFFAAHCIHTHTYGLFFKSYVLQARLLQVRRVPESCELLYLLVYLKIYM